MNLSKLARRLFAAGTLDAEIFATGEWHGKVYTPADLAQLAANFATLQGLHQVPLKLGHADAQRWFGQGDGAPALGWVSKVWVKGSKLMATFTGIPDAVSTLIEAGRYRRVSCEIYPDVPVDGKNIGLVLGAVALLGADLPEVNTLQDLQAVLHGLEAGEARKMQFTGQPAVVVRDNPRYPPEEAQMTEEEKRRLLEELRTSMRAEFSRETDALKAQLLEKDAELLRFKAKQTDEQKQARAEKFVAARKAVLDLARELVSKFQLMPALYDKLDVAIDVQRDAFSTDTGKLVFSQDFVVELLTAVQKNELGGKRGTKPATVRLNHGTGQPASEDDLSVEDAGRELRRLADIELDKLKAQQPGKVGLFSKAWENAARAHPALALKARVDALSFANPNASGEV